MKKMKKLIAVFVAVGMLGVAGVAFAATAKTPAEIVSGITGKSVEDVTKARTDGKTFGTIANDAGKLDEFKVQMLKEKKAILDQRVKDGKLTKERSDEIYKALEKNQANCDGTGKAAMGKKAGAGLGQGQGKGMGKGQGGGMGAGMRNGGGFGAGV